MAVIVTDNRTIRNEADATTGWTAAGTSTGTGTGTETPTPREATAHVVTTATSNTPANQWLWHTGASLGTGPHLIYVWMLTTATIGTRTNGGLMVLLGDGANRVGYHVGGDDFAPFRVDSDGLVSYMCFCIDTAQLATWPNGATVQAGTRAGLEANVNAITQIGTGCQVLAKALGGAVNYWNDIIRVGVATTISTSGLTISSGSSSNPGKFTEIEFEDRQITNQKAHGIIRELGTGLFGIQGTLRFGDQGTESSWFEETDVTCIFETRGFATNRYKIVITDNGVGTTTFRLGTKVGTGVTATGQNGVTFIAPPGVGAEFISSGSNVTDVFMYGSSFIGFSEGIRLGENQEAIGCIFSQGGTVFPGTGSAAILVNSSFNNLLTTRASSSLYWNANSDTAGNLDGCSFTVGATGSHAIELGPDTPTTINFNNIEFTGYTGSLGSNLVPSSGPVSASVYNNSSKEITINVVGGTTPSVRNGAGATTIVNNNITITITGLKDNTEVRVYNSGTPTEIAGIETVVDGTVDNRTFAFSTQANTEVDIVIISLVYENERINGYIVPSTNSSIPIQQRIDRNYLNPPGP
jgi:hypothetical protein